MSRRSTTLSGPIRDQPLQAQCIGLLMDAGCKSRRNVPAVLALMRDRLDVLATMLDADPGLVHRRFAELDFGSTAYRRMTLKGGTLLHVAAEYGSVEAARMLVARGADVNARADVDIDGIGGQTALFHAVSQFYDYGTGGGEVPGGERGGPEGARTNRRGTTSGRRSLWSALRWGTRCVFRGPRARRSRFCGRRGHQSRDSGGWLGRGGARYTSAVTVFIRNCGRFLRVRNGGGTEAAAPGVCRLTKHGVKPFTWGECLRQSGCKPLPGDLCWDWSRSLRFSPI